jgi:hypothetical protein
MHNKGARIPPSPQSAAELARNALNEIARLSPSGRVTLLIDGLEKVPNGPGSLEPFDALGALPDCTDLVVVVPWHAAFGPRSEQVLRPDEHFLMVRAPEVADDDAPGREFLRQILLARTPVPAESSNPPNEAERLAYANVVNEAARWSGGIPRIFLSCSSWRTPGRMLGFGAKKIGQMRATWPLPEQTRRTASGRARPVSLCSGITQTIARVTRTRVKHRTQGRPRTRLRVAETRVRAARRVRRAVALPA